MKKITLIGMGILIILLVGCESSYNDCKYDCQRYIRNCSIEGSFCIPLPCDTNHTCNPNDVNYCFERCIG